MLSYVGVTGAYSSGDRGNGNPDDEFSTLGIEGLVTYGFATGVLLAFEGSYNSNSGGEEIFGGDEPGDDAEIALHVLYDLRPGLTVGGFYSAGLAESVRDDDTEHYPFSAFGVSGSYAINDQFSTYAQVAVVDQPDFDNLSSGGYNEGYAARLGVNYAVNDQTAVYFDVQYGEAEDYEDAGEDGVFERYAIGGETMIGSGNWAFNYEVAQETYDAVTDSNVVEVTTATLGARYYFGGTTGSDLRDRGILGTPDIMGRASLFTEGLD